MLSHLKAPLPQYPVLPTNNIVLKLRHREASDAFFRELRMVLAAVQYTLDTPALGALAQQLMVPTNHETGLHLTPENLAADCRCALYFHSTDVYNVLTSIMPVNTDEIVTDYKAV